MTILVIDLNRVLLVYENGVHLVFSVWMVTEIGSQVGRFEDLALLHQLLRLKVQFCFTRLNSSIDTTILSVVRLIWCGSLTYHRHLLL